MRLLNSNTLEFEEFFESDRPKYGILSHRWGKEECDLKDFRTITEAAKDTVKNIDQKISDKLVDGINAGCKCHLLYQLAQVIGNRLDQNHR